MYVIADYDEHYKPTDTKGRDLVHAKYVKMPVKPRGKGVRALMKRDDGIEVFGIWALILEAATETKKPELRGKLLNHKDEPASIEEIADSINCDHRSDAVKNAINVLVSMGWVEHIKDDAKKSVPDTDKAPPKRSEVKRSEVNIINDDIKSIFDHWNLQKENGRWKTHYKLTPDIQNVAQKMLKDWSAEEIRKAISNFALLVQGKDYTWTYDKWGLREFLSRTESDNKMPKWLRFHPNNFREDEWLTETAQKRRIQQRKQYTEGIMNATPEKIRENYAVNALNLNWLVRELRPEALEEEDNAA